MNNFELIEFSLFLKERAHWTHNFINRSCILGLGILEETITDMNLFSIADRYEKNIIIRKFGRKEEGNESGADWLWIIGAPGNWLFLLIQAKLINPISNKCNYLNYKNGEQRKLLLRYARSHGFLPLYCIYSSIPEDFLIPNEFSYKEYVDHEKEDWACSFVSPKIISKLANNNIKDQKQILQYAIPWMDPFRILAYEKDDTKVYSEVASAFIEIKETQINEDFSKKDSKEYGKMPDRISWSNLDTRKAKKTKIPANICNLIKCNTVKDAIAPAPILGIISQVPISEIEELR